MAQLVLSAVESGEPYADVPGEERVSGRLRLVERAVPHGKGHPPVVVLGGPGLDETPGPIAVEVDPHLVVAQPFEESQHVEAGLAEVAHGQQAEAAVQQRLRTAQ